MRIIGIDPGYDRVGIAIIDNKNLIYSECFETNKKDDFYVRLKSVGLKIKEIIEIYKPEVMAIESIFITKNQKTATKVAEARGVISYEASLKNIPIREFSPPQIKMAVTGHGSSNKTQIIKMIPLLIKKNTLEKNKKIIDDEYDAIAVALTCQAHGNNIYPQSK